MGCRRQQGGAAVSGWRAVFWRDARMPGSAAIAGQPCPSETPAQRSHDDQVGTSGLLGVLCSTSRSPTTAAEGVGSQPRPSKGPSLQAQLSGPHDRHGQLHEHPCPPWEPGDRWAPRPPRCGREGAGEAGMCALPRASSTAGGQLDRSCMQTVRLGRPPARAGGRRLPPAAAAATRPKHAACACRGPTSAGGAGASASRVCAQPHRRPQLRAHL